MERNASGGASAGVLRAISAGKRLRGGRAVRRTLSVVLLVMLSVLAWVPVVRAAEVGTVVEGNNAFALELYAKLSGEEGNLFLSPYSISTALAMTYAGARGETGIGRGAGYTLNIPLRARTPAREQRRMFEAALGEIDGWRSMPSATAGTC